MIAACVDRWALTSQNVRIRSFSHPKIARYVILCLILIWPIIPIHMAIFINNYSGRCGPPKYYALAFSIYLFIFIGIIPPFLMMFFGILAWKNLKLIRSRVTPMNFSRPSRFQQGDRDLMRMLTGEVCVYIISTCLYPIDILYGFITASITQDKSEMRLAIESLVGFIISPILNYIYCVAQFYSRKMISIKNF